MSTTTADAGQNPTPSSFPRVVITLLAVYLAAFAMLAGYAAFNVWPGTATFESAAAPSPAEEKPAATSDKPTPADTAAISPSPADAAPAASPDAAPTTSDQASSAAPDGAAVANPGTSTKPAAATTPAVTTRDKSAAAAGDNPPKCASAACQMERHLVLFVFYLGVLGACIHAITSLTTYAGNATFEKSWTAWYLLRPVIGGVLAWIVFLVFRGGFLGTTQAQVLNPYAFGALGALSGLFSKRVIDKLGELVETVFRMPPGKGDGERTGKVLPGAPSIEDTDPKTLSEAAASTTLSIIGKGFEAGCVVELAGKPLTPTEITPTRLKVIVPGSSLAGLTSSNLVVRLAGEQGKTSNTFAIKVTK